MGWHYLQDWLIFQLIKLKRVEKAIMAKPLDPKEVVSIEELVTSNMCEIEVLIGVLGRKGIVR